LDLLADLNEPQRRAVTLVDGPLLVLAGAGSGKTRVITRRVAYLIGQGIAPGNILAVTFTNKAAGEMLRRIAELNCPRGSTICTFHSLCARLLREFAEQANLSRNFTIYDRADQLKVVKDVMVRCNIRTGNFPAGPVHSTISRAKNALKTADQFAADAEGNFYRRTVAAVYREYEKQLAAANALDFDDLLLRMALLLRDSPDVRQILRRRYRYILIDEYQDTNHAQYLIAHGIAVDHENVCVTGDPDQSIYAWRGADVGNILEFEADYPNATVICLEENYRSTKPILTAASRLISHNRIRKDKELWTRRSGGPDVRVVLCDDAQAEAELVARRIADYHAGGGAFSDVAIFYRVNSLSRTVEQTLLRHAVPYRVARGVEFYNRKEVKDVLAYLRLMVNGADDVSCLRVINTPARGIGATTVKRLASFAGQRGMSLLAACARPEDAGVGPAAAKKVAAFAAMIDGLSARADRPVQQVMEDVVRLTGLEESLAAGDEQGGARDNVGELISTAAEFDRDYQGQPDAPAGALAEYLHQVSLVSDIDHVEGQAQAVTLMTLHAAKGLEFPVVFIIGCEEGLLPFDRGQPDDDARSVSAAAQLEEERRLAFVGMTRAKDQLTMTAARYRMQRGRTTPQAASSFLTEIGADGVKLEDLTTAQARPLATHAKGRGGFYADVQQRELIEAGCEHALPGEYEYLKVGSTVRHPQFGLGKVTALAQRWPETRATIAFRHSGTKKIVLARTTLEVVWGD